MFACGKEGSDVKTDWSQSFATVLLTACPVVCLLQTWHV